MLSLLPSTLLSLLFALPAFSHASPSPALVSSDFEISLIPRHQLFLRQLNDLQIFTSALGGVRASPITNSGDTERPFRVDGDTFNDFQSAAGRSCDNQFQGCQAVANGNGGQVRAQSNGGGGGNSGQQRKQQSDNGNGNGNGKGNGNGNGNGDNNNNGDGNGNGNGNQNGNGNRDGNDNNNDRNNNNNNDRNRRSEVYANETDSILDKRQNGGITVNQCDEQKNQCKSALDATTIKDFNTALQSINIGPDPNFPDFDLICEGA
ncbi:hypothetical protein HBI56_119920 [Parastagonospora nodorum]|nr:hypothetical protein HBI79_132360 [Parastagonospora nodorum]KAH4957490.1 hypothetical protein HBI78_186270 [Parastagonospora nodorum]KAH5053740.1 hypothetical protein HBH96_147580 [Parastagonospora nodorum]KAH5202671.1 hypothetical protein HBH77_118240 [Parastagonospora nodorum]KAH5249222.1 hypothetical protein HBI72_159250 [Parastagonospora nodorum]